MTLLCSWVLILPLVFSYGVTYAEFHASTSPARSSGKVSVILSRLSSTSQFGGTTNSSGYGVKYIGNVGDPYGSNIIEVPENTANQCKYVLRFEGPVAGESWTVVIWNKIGPDGLLSGWYGQACRKFILKSGQVRYIAVDENSQGGWAAAPGDSIAVDSQGGYASTWGEFDFGSVINSGWSGFDVSAIAAQNAGLPVQGMKICDVLAGICSFVTKDAALIHNAYISSLAEVGGIGGNLYPGPVRLAVTIGYDTAA
ncbi:Allergen Asp f 4 [Penicillium oxalicum]|uniref:Allergen Asp f 4 n=1 Tax=Penicillium oxalicum TaxID=69781 RepID=UPI0020B65123|nr:Allergen Asp f 4 [Penicillium oxalicum]KAI2787063.1 Allergen Asp f 4 [Penicillium oxalicum]